MVKIKVLNKYDYQTYPIVEGMIFISEKNLDQIGRTLKFDVASNIVPMTEEDKKELNGEG